MLGIDARHAGQPFDQSDGALKLRQRVVLHLSADGRDAIGVIGERDVRPRTANADALERQVEHRQARHGRDRVGHLGIGRCRVGKHAKAKPHLVEPDRAHGVDLIDDEIGQPGGVDRRRLVGRGVCAGDPEGTCPGVPLRGLGGPAVGFDRHSREQEDEILSWPAERPPVGPPFGKSGRGDGRKRLEARQPGRRIGHPQPECERGATRIEAADHVVEIRHAAVPPPIQRPHESIGFDDPFAQKCLPERNRGRPRLEGSRAHRECGDARRRPRTCRRLPGRSPQPAPDAPRRSAASRRPAPQGHRRDTRRPRRRGSR